MFTARNCASPSLVRVSLMRHTATCIQSPPSVTSNIGDVKLVVPPPPTNAKDTANDPSESDVTCGKSILCGKAVETA